MLQAIGVSSIEDLFGEIPAGLRLDRPLELDEGLSEQEVSTDCGRWPSATSPVTRRCRSWVRGCTTTTCRRWWTPITQRSEFLTPYTPYQPEISQGGLQAMFEYQTAISSSPACPCPTPRCTKVPARVGAAGYLAKLTNGRGRFVISRGVHPHSRLTLATMARAWGAEVVEAPLNDGITELPRWTRR